MGKLPNFNQEEWSVEKYHKIPTVFTDITEMEDSDKVNDFLNVYAGLVANLIEVEVAHRALIDSHIAQAEEDPELQEMEQEKIAEAISMLEDVQEVEGLVEESRNALDLFHTSLLRILVSGE